jgi:hypothetical protein
MSRQFIDLYCTMLKSNYKSPYQPAKMNENESKLLNQQRDLW